MRFVSFLLELLNCKMTLASFDVNSYLRLGRLVDGEHLLIKKYNNILENNNHVHLNYFYGLCTRSPFAIFLIIIPCIYLNGPSIDIMLYIN